MNTSGEAGNQLRNTGGASGGRPGPTPRPKGYAHLLKDPSLAAEVPVNFKLPNVRSNKNLNG